MWCSLVLASRNPQPCRVLLGQHVCWESLLPHTAAWGPALQRSCQHGKCISTGDADGNAALFWPSQRLHVLNRASRWLPWAGSRAEPHSKHSDSHLEYATEVTHFKFGG